MAEGVNLNIAGDGSNVGIGDIAGGSITKNNSTHDDSHRQAQRVVVNLERPAAARMRPRKVVDDMSPMLTEISNKLQEFEIKLDRVLTTLGDDVLHGPGLVSKFNELREDVNEMRSVVENMRYGLWLFGSIATVAFVGLCVMILRAV